MEYIVVEEIDPGEIGKRVTGLLDDGWELYGPPMLAAYSSKGDKDVVRRTIYAQALLNRRGDDDLDALELTVRTTQALRDANLTTVARISKKTPRQLLAVKGLGKKALNEIKEVLVERGIQLVDDLGDGLVEDEE